MAVCAVAKASRLLEDKDFPKLAPRPSGPIYSAGHQFVAVNIEVLDAIGAKSWR
jgi:hypothetical protein